MFFTQDGSRKARNLRADPRVAISIVNRENPYATGWLRGRVVKTIGGDEALEIIDGLALKYTGKPFPMRSGTVFVIEAERAGSMTLPFSPFQAVEHRGDRGREVQAGDAGAHRDPDPCVRGF